MNNYSRCRHIYSRFRDFESAALDLLQKSGMLCRGTLTRITIFGKCADDTEYERNVEFLERSAFKIFSSKGVPLVSYVTQPLLAGGGYVAEVQTIDMEVSFRSLDGTRYIIMENEDMKRIMMCGVKGSVKDSVRVQSDVAFEKIANVFAHEGFVASDIFKQWNYIAQITATDADDYQNYQAFNDSRSEFYRTADWSVRGYPAATGIGMDCGAVTVDLIAVKPLNDKIKVIPIDNDLQLAAHVYSQGVLIGIEGDKIEGKSTPKFERAKALGNKDEGYVCYISGTAAIRGEASIGDDAAEQAVLTMENIEHLISEHTCKKYDIELSEAERKVYIARAYVKFESDTAAIRAAVNKRWPHVSMIYLLADVCRDELLVEIEAVSNLPVEV